MSFCNISQDPNILLLDEPLSGLDSVSSIQVMQSLQYIVERCGCIALLTVHQPSEAIMEYFDKLLVVSAGKLALDCRISDDGVQNVSAKLNDHLCDSHRRSSQYVSQAFIHQSTALNSEFMSSVIGINPVDNSVHPFLNSTHNRTPLGSARTIQMAMIEESDDDDSNVDDDAKSFEETSSTADDQPSTPPSRSSDEELIDHREKAFNVNVKGPSVMSIFKDDITDDMSSPRRSIGDRCLDLMLLSMCCFDARVLKQIRPIVQRMQRQYGWGWKDIVPANVALLIVSLVLTTEDSFTMRALFLTVALVGIPVIVFPHKVFQYAETWSFHKRELDDKRISMVAFQIGTSMFTFAVPTLSLTMAVAISYAIVGLDYQTFLNQVLFSVIHLLVALQLGRALAVLFQGHNPSIVQVFTFYLFLSFLMSSTFVASYKYPVEIRWIHYFSIDFWAISGAVMNQLDDEVNYSNAEDCFDFVSCLASDGGLIVSVLGFSGMSTSFFALGILTTWFIVFLALEQWMLHYRCEGI